MQAVGNNAPTPVVDSPIQSGGGAGGLLNNQKDAAEASTAAQFGDVLKKMQAAYGAKAEKPREIKKTLGKDDFLRIMITQMRHQDPTNPFKAEQMAAEMAQFTTVEQLQNMNQSLTKMAGANQPLERLAMTGLIGKSVTVDRNRFAHVEGQNESLSFRLPKDASEVHAIVVSEAGEVVLEKDLGKQSAGEVSVTWDGLKKNTLPAKSGNYMLRIEAKDERGAGIQTDPQKRVRVVGVSFEGGEPILLVGDNKSQEKITMKNVIRIEAEMGGAPGMGSPLSGGAQSIPASNAPNFISFQKGVGSGNLDTNASPEIAEAIAKYQAAQQAPSGGNAQAPAQKLFQQGARNVDTAQAAPSTGEEKGFPNGLSDSESSAVEQNDNPENN